MMDRRRRNGAPPAPEPAARGGAAVLPVPRPGRRTRGRRLGNAPGGGFVPPTTGGLCTTTRPPASRFGPPGAPRAPPSPSSRSGQEPKQQVTTRRRVDQGVDWTRPVHLAVEGSPVPALWRRGAFVPMVVPLPHARRGERVSAFRSEISS